jgi:hypothetical protein
MRSILLILNLFLALTSFSQTLNTGDKELDATLSKMNADAKTNLTSFKTELAKTYTTTTSKIDELMKKGMAISDVFMTFEIAKITKKPVDTVVKSYEVNKNKGWGAIAKEMGIKPGSPEFHQLKGNSKKGGKPSNSSTSPAPAKGKPANPGKGNSKGKG